MGLAVLLWFIFISLQLDRSLEFPTSIDYRVNPASQNLLHDGDDVFWDGLSYDEGQGEDEGYERSGPVTGYGIPSGALPKDLIPAGQNVPNMIGQLSSKYPSVNVSPKMVPAGQNAPNMIGQLSSGYPTVNVPPNMVPVGQNVPPNMVPAGQNAPNMIGQLSSGYPSVNVPPNIVSTGQNVPPSRVPAGQNTPSMIGQLSSGYPSVNVPPNIVSTGQNVPPSMVPAGQNAPNMIGQLSSGYPSVNMPPNMIPAGQNVPPNIVSTEQIVPNMIGQLSSQYVPPNSVPTEQNVPNTIGQLSSQYPSVNVQPQSSPCLNIAQSVGQSNEIDCSTGYATPPKKTSPQGPAGSQPDEDWMGFLFSNFFGDEDFDDLDFEPENTVIDTEKYWFPQVGFLPVAEGPLSPPPRPQSYIVHVKGGYKRGRVSHTKAFYSPQYEMAKIEYPKSLMLTAGPAEDPYTSRKS